MNVPLPAGTISRIRAVVRYGSVSGWFRESIAEALETPQEEMTGFNVGPYRETAGFSIEADLVPRIDTARAAMGGPSRALWLRSAILHKLAACEGREAVAAP